MVLGGEDDLGHPRAVARPEPATGELRGAFDTVGAVDVVDRVVEPRCGLGELGVEAQALRHEHVETADHLGEVVGVVMLTVWL